MTLNKYITNKFLRLLSQELGLFEFVQYEDCKSNTDIIMKAFFGCLSRIVDEKLCQKHFGYVVCYRLVEIIFSDVKIQTEKDSKTQLKELEDKATARKLPLMALKMYKRRK